ncbi:uncharacterized protein E0L32_010780 [Thyridium curvatum]|uniref:Tat pathway signal sequence domain protein n=1 Tax=Thyridium curvatum TaxID=1093900 RepID=A0A507AJ27_9PEZI|nr:uncharacterized protein E0L32_010780 [Thyridium curvatum]TPX07283.1 hypothetical protein E0L32_010780 [Thyridium curvatum]
MADGNLQWLSASAGSDAALANGVSFGMPWPKGLYKPGQNFVIKGEAGTHPLDSRPLAFWPDGSYKWTAHSVSGDISYSKTYTVQGGAGPGLKDGFTVDRNNSNISISNRSGLELRLAPTGSSKLFESLTYNGQLISSGATIVASISNREYSPLIKKVNIENQTSSRIVIKVSGVVISDGTEHLPFDVRVYTYSDSSSLRIIHSFVHDLEGDEPLTSLGLKFSIPLQDTGLYNRHIRLGGSDGGILREEVQGLTGLRYGPTVQNRIDQAAGRVVSLREDEWEGSDFKRGLACIPSFDAYSLAQLSSDGFTIKKRTKCGHAWVKVPGGGRADGIAYVGSANHGGLAVGMSDFWERYPTQIDLNDLTKEEASITLWLYSPLAEPLDTTPFHDDLGLDTYKKQYEAVYVTYEDYEPGFATANGIARSNQLFLQPFLDTPSNTHLASFSALVREPPRLIPELGYMHSTDVFHGCWSPDFRIAGYFPSEKEADIEKNLDLLFSHYRGQIEQHRWYGFWDYGDVQHTYDPYRHSWRYDVGGYAWDNSELSTDLWLWLYFLHTGRSDVFKVAESMTRHTGEVDVYHSGRFKGFGTRHGVQHWMDSSKQLRISNVLYRRIYYYLTGDERTGDLMEELQQCQKALLGLDSHRKVFDHVDLPEGFALANIGLDCGALAASWLTTWERRTPGWEQARTFIGKLLSGLSTLPLGIASNEVLLNPTTCEIRQCPPPMPRYLISHLSILFGLPETITEVLETARNEFPSEVRDFERVWISYCKSYNGGADIQRTEFGFEFGPVGWKQSHSTLTAIAAVVEQSDELGTAAWDQFFKTDGYDETHDWTIVKASPPVCLQHGEEAPWVTTNETARYGISALFNLANVRKYLQ